MAERFKLPESVQRYVDKTQRINAQRAKNREENERQRKAAAERRTLMAEKMAIAAQVRAGRARNMQIEANRKALLEDFGRAILHKREVLGLSALQMAEILKVKGGESEYVLIEQGEKSYDVEFAFRVSKLLQIPMDPLLSSIDVSHEKQMITEAIKDVSVALDDEMKQLQKRIEELKTKKNVVQRISNGRHDF